MSFVSCGLTHAHFNLPSKMNYVCWLESFDHSHEYWLWILPWLSSQSHSLVQTLRSCSITWKIWEEEVFRISNMSHKHLIYSAQKSCNHPQLLLLSSLNSDNSMYFSSSLFQMFILRHFIILLYIQGKYTQIWRKSGKIYLYLKMVPVFFFYK